MRLQTKRFGTIDVNPQDELTIAGGLLGLEGLERWTLHRAAGFGLFVWLQCIDEPDIALIVTPARAILPDYHANVTDMELEPLEMKDGDELDCLIVLREPTDCRRMTANLMGPIIVNSRTRRGVQVVLHDSDYSMSHRILQCIAKGTEAA